MNIETYAKFVQAHEKIVLGAGVLLIFLYLGNQWINHSSDKAIAAAAAANQALQSQIQANQQLAVQVQQQMATYQQLVDRLTAQNQTLMAGMAQRTQQTAVQQKTDLNMPLAMLTARWGLLIGNTNSDFNLVPSGVTVAENAARNTVSQLEELPALKQDVKDLQTIVTNKDTQIDQQTDLVHGLQKQVSGLNVQLVDTSNACKAQVAVVKAADRKGKRNWFLRGLFGGAGIVVFILR